MLIGMIFVGSIYGLVETYFAAKGSNVLMLAVYAASVWTMLNGLEAVMSLGLFGVLKGVLVLLLVAGFLGLARPSRSAGERARTDGLRPVGMRAR